jgi:hypothetical protein
MDIPMPGKSVAGRLRFSLPSANPFTKNKQPIQVPGCMVPSHVSEAIQEFVFLLESTQRLFPPFALKFFEIGDAVDQIASNALP